MITTVDGLRYGQLVVSTAGRDLGEYYIIWNMYDENFLELVNGTTHPLTKPKKKNLKHVKVTMAVATDVEISVLRGESLKNAQIIEAIQKRLNELEEGDRFNG